MNAKVLIVDDEGSTREGIARALRASGYEVFLAGSGDEAMGVLKENSIDLMLTDLRMKGMGGLQLIEEAKKAYPDLKVIAFTAYGSIEVAVDAMKRGADDYLSKPVNLDELELIFEKTLKTKKIENENKLLREQLNRNLGLEKLIGQSPRMKEIYELIEQVAPTKASVLIQGESGTGKELIANAIHQLSQRKDKPFIPVHCAALSESLLESELFGHEKGAFTGAHEKHVGRFERADGGTLFLDEISEISPKIQVKLLRVLQETAFERVGGNQTIHVDVRLISATNTDLKKNVDEGQFRNDLYYRLHVVFIQMPPLRERREDIPLLIRHFLKEAAKENDKPVKAISPQAMDLLMDYSWPGNVRELRNCIQSLVVLSKRDEIGVNDLSANIRNFEGSKQPALNSGLALKDAEKTLIVKTLQSTNNNKTRAAELLGISRRTLHRKLREYQLDEHQAN